MQLLTRLALIVLFMASAAACNRSGAREFDPTATNAAASPAAAPEPARAETDGTAPTTGARNAAPDARSNVAAVSWREVTIPAGTTLPVVLDTSVGSDSSRVEDPVRAHVSRAVMVHGVAVVPEGSLITGVVTASQRPGKVKGTGHVAVRFDTLHASDERYRIHTAAVGRTAPTQKKKDAVEIGAPAAGGAIIGGILGGKKGAVIGGAAGGGAGTAVVMNQRGKDARLGKGAALTLRLTEPVTIRVRG